MSDIREIKIAYLTALQNGDTAKAAELLNLLNESEDKIPGRNTILPSFPEDQAVKLCLWMNHPDTDLWHLNGIGEGLPRSDLESIITRDWKRAFDKSNPIRTLHELIYTDQRETTH